MNGPRLFARTHVAALAALMLLPACSPRKPIPSDPPEVRTEAQVRGAAKKSTPVVEQAPVAAAAAPAPAQPKTEAAPAAPAKADVLVAEVKAEPAEAAEAAAPVIAAAEVAPVAAKTTEAKQANVKPAEVKPAEANQTEAKVAQSSSAPAVVKTEVAKPELKTEAAKPEAATAEASKAEASAPGTAAASDVTAKDAGSDTAKDAERPAMVQIASFGTEKNAQAALAWLKEKGYSEARVVRVEQAQTVYHRVQAGPFQDPAAARKALEELKVDWPQAFIPAD